MKHPKNKKKNKDQEIKNKEQDTADIGAFAVLPTEIIILIFFMLTVKEFPTLSMVCKDFSTLISNEFYKKFYQQTYPDSYKQFSNEVKNYNIKILCKNAFLKSKIEVGGSIKKTTVKKNEDGLFELKYLILGEDDCKAKTLIKKYCNSTDSKISRYRHQMKLDCFKNLKLHIQFVSSVIQDAQGMDNYKNLHCAIVMFDMENMNSLKDAETMLIGIKDQIGHRNVISVFVGGYENKQNIRLLEKDIAQVADKWQVKYCYFVNLQSLVEVQNLFEKINDLVIQHFQSSLKSDNIQHETNETGISNKTKRHCLVC